MLLINLAEHTEAVFVLNWTRPTVRRSQHAKGRRNSRNCGDRSKLGEDKKRQARSVGFFSTPVCRTYWTTQVSVTFLWFNTNKLQFAQQHITTSPPTPQVNVGWNLTVWLIYTQFVWYLLILIVKIYNFRPYIDLKTIHVHHWIQNNHSNCVLEWSYQGQPAQRKTKKQLLQIWTCPTAKGF